MTRLEQIFRRYQESRVLHTRIPVQEAIDDRTFLTKAGFLVQILAVGGLDDECLDPGQIDHISRQLESALRLLDENFRLYQYLIKTPAKPLESSKRHLAVIQEALAARTAYLNSKQLSEIKHYWAIVYEGTQLGRRRHAMASFLKQPGKTLKTWLSETKTIEDLEQAVNRCRQILTQRVTSLVVQLQDLVKLRVLDNLHRHPEVSERALWSRRPRPHRNPDA